MSRRKGRVCAWCGGMRFGAGRGDADTCSNECTTDRWSAQGRYGLGPIAGMGYVVAWPLHANLKPGSRSRLAPVMAGDGPTAVVAT